MATCDSLSRDSRLVLVGSSTSSSDAPSHAGVLVGLVLLVGLSARQVLLDLQQKLHLSVPMCRMCAYGLGRAQHTMAYTHAAREHSLQLPSALAKFQHTCGAEGLEMQAKLDQIKGAGYAQRASGSGECTLSAVVSAGVSTRESVACCVLCCRP